MASVDQTNFRQDMPPEGGYGKIFVQRTFPRINPKLGKRFALATAVIMTCGYFKFRAMKAANTRWQVEENDIRLILQGFYSAERDRLWLNYLRRLRNEERDLMKDVPGWRVGTFYGEPIYYTLPRDSWWDPAEFEVSAHNSYYRNKFSSNWRMDVDMRGGPKWYDKYLPFWMENL